MLRVKYGWEGEGKFWALNNRIAESENCELNLSKKYNKASIANDLDFTIDEFEEFLEYLEKECDLIIKENNYITNEIVRENLLKVMKERKRNKDNYENRNIQDVNTGSTRGKRGKDKIQHVEKIKQEPAKERVKVIFTYWNKGVGIKHLVLDDKIKAQINTTLKNYSLEQIKQGIDNYKVIREDDNCMDGKKWGLVEFLKQANGLAIFLDLESVKDRYKKRGLQSKGGSYVQIERHKEGYPEGTVLK